MNLAVAHQTNASMPGADWPPVYDPTYRPDPADPYWFRDVLPQVARASDGAKAGRSGRRFQPAGPP